MNDWNLMLPKRVVDMTFGEAVEALGLHATAVETMYRRQVFAPGWHIEGSAISPAMTILVDPEGHERAKIHNKMDYGNENCSMEIVEADLILPPDRRIRLAYWAALFDFRPEDVIPYGLDPRFFMSHILMGLQQVTNEEVAQAISDGGRPGTDTTPDTIVSNLLERGVVSQEAVALANRVREWLGVHGLPERAIAWWDQPQD